MAGAKPPPKISPTLTITPDGRAEVFTGCNHGSGSARVRDDGFIDFGPLTLTRMACDASAMRVEQAVTTTLNGSVAAGFSGPNLSLSKRGKPQLVFRPR